MITIELTDEQARWLANTLYVELLNYGNVKRKRTDSDLHREAVYTQLKTKIKKAQKW